jgi:hypothetical protein
VRGFIEDVRVPISAVGPNHRSSFGIDANLGEERRVLEGGEQAAATLGSGGEVDSTPGAVGEGQGELPRGRNFDLGDA